MDVSTVSLKQIKKMIKQHGFNIKYLAEEFQAIYFDPDEILFYKYTSTDNIIRITKRIKDKNSAHTIIFDLNKFDSAKFDSLSDNVKKTIMDSPEYRAIFKQSDTKPTTSNEFGDDDIPF